MGYSSLLSFSLCFLVLFNVCFARIQPVRHHQQEQQPQERLQSKCQLQNLNALRPQQRFKSEAGLTEFWDQNEQQFQCAGVAFLRHIIERKGLLLPSFTNGPMLVYVVQGEGLHGAVFPGCPETFHSESQQSQSPWERPQRFSPELDQHQKIRRIREGDVLALPAGVSHWIHNNGPSQLVLVALVDVGNNANQLDENFRKFFLGGNPQEGVVRGGRGQSQSQWWKSQSQSPRWQREEEEQSEQNNGNNLLSGFDENLLAEVFRIEPRLAKKLQNENDRRGAIVRMEHEIECPETAEGEQQREQRSEEWWRSTRDNGVEETFCSMKLKHRTDSSFADVFNPRAGRITSVNSFNLPILDWLQLSAERGVLYNNAIYAPHWNINAHSIVYITRGNGRMQIVSENGEAIFDDKVEEGQVITVPQNHAVVKKAGEQGFEWIAFKTNANAKISQIAGRVSVMRGLPVDVVANSFGISREDAMQLKNNRQEVSVFSPRQGYQQ